MAKRVADLADALRDHLDHHGLDVVTFPPQDFYHFVGRTTVRSAFEEELEGALNDVQLLYRRGASCFIILRDYNFSEIKALGDIESVLQRPAEDCAEIIKDLLCAERKNVISIRWDDLYEFVGRQRWRDSFDKDLNSAARRFEMQYIQGSSCGLFVKDYNFSPMKPGK